MLLNKVDVDRFAASHNERVVSAVIQFLEIFHCCHNLRKALVQRREDRLEEARVAAEEASRKLHRVGYRHEERVGTYREHIDSIPDEPDLPRDVVGVCPRCGHALRGEALGSCEARATGRVFYAMCSKCIYYSEVFQIGKNKYKEVEGG
jgi:hypothetical protein